MNNRSEVLRAVPVKLDSLIEQSLRVSGAFHDIFGLHISLNKHFWLSGNFERGGKAPVALIRS